MIREERARAVVYDNQTDVTRVLVGNDAGSGAGTGERRAVDLLLDANGHLVGVDLGGEGFKRKVVMVGPHESVASTKPATVVMTHAAGQPDEVASIAIESARALIRGNEKNPYV